MVARMLVDYLPQFPFDAQAMKYLPATVLREAARNIQEESDLRLPGMYF